MKFQLENINKNLLPNFFLFLWSDSFGLEEGWDTLSFQTELRVLTTGVWVLCCKDDEKEDKQGV